MATEIKTRYYKIIVNKKGRRVLITHKKMLADAICYCTEEKAFVFDDEDGKRIFSIECNERTQKIAEMLVSLHFEALKLKQEEEQEQSNK